MSISKCRRKCEQSREPLVYGGFACLTFFWVFSLVGCGICGCDVMIGGCHGCDSSKGPVVGGNDGNLGQMCVGRVLSSAWRPFKCA